MFADVEPLFPARPFWFASEELLTNVLRAEINAVTQLLAKYPDIPNLFDVPEATVPQRTACFELLAHRKLTEIIFEMFEGRYEESPSLSDEDSKALRRTQDLVARDAPAWVRDIDEVAELLPSRIYDALPEPLRTEGYDVNNSAQIETIKSAAETLGSVEQIQLLIRGVLDQQVRRLERRWSPASVQVWKPNTRKRQRRRDTQRRVRDELIAEIDDVAETLPEFLRLMDERKVRPQPTWTEWPGSWVQAYKNPRLRALIHKDKSRALSRARPGRSR